MNRDCARMELFDHYLPTRVLLLLLVFSFLEFRVVSPITEKEILLQFKGNISSDPYNSLSTWDLSSKDPCQDYSGVFCNSDGNIEKIVLWNTSLGGVLSPALSGLKSLRVLTLFGNQFTGKIPSQYGEIETLWKINLSSNALSGPVPYSLGDLPNIRLIDLSRNGCSGEIPSALFKNCSKTRFVSFSHNDLSGSIPESVGNCLNLVGIDLSFNNLSGGLPSQICYIPGLEYLSLRRNELAGSVREQLLSCQSLELLDLGSNSFTGLAPFEVLGLTNLTYFNISHNGFEGEITGTEDCSEKLQVLDASSNQLYGQIPLSIANCNALEFLDLGFNSLNGSIPTEVGDLTGLLVIQLGNNSIEGTIPAEFGKIEYLRVLDLHMLNLVGNIPECLSKCRFLLELDLSGNALRGEIPQTLYNMSQLEILDLHRNQLNGNIPKSLGSLSQIQFLDLTNNSLSGSIPASLENLQKLTHFNLSFNKLSGSIPSTIQHFGFLAFFHNPGLCGAPLEESPCSGNGKTPESGNPKLSDRAILAIVSAAAILTGVCVITIANMKVRRGRGDDDTWAAGSAPLDSSSTDSNILVGKLVLFSTSLPSKIEDWEVGKRALLDQESLIGGGSIGTVYRANFEGGVSIAVKKLETLGSMRNQDEFEGVIGRLGNLQHRNIVAFHGYYWSSGMRLILSEFVPNGNLYDNLHGFDYPGTSTGVGNPELNWPKRLRIALGTAGALAYLHHEHKPPFLHLNLKSTNILLDENYEPKLSDYGLGKLVPLFHNYGLTKFHDAVGYVAPELGQSLRLMSEKCDVYSFGVILLELVTGRKPVESQAENEVVILCDYVRWLMESGTASDCFDRSLKGSAENEVIQVIKLGLICTSEMPSRRPSMSEVVQILVSIRSRLE